MKRILFQFLFCCVAPAGFSPLQAATPGPGGDRYELPSGGRARSYFAHVSPQANAGALPLVVSLHGGGGNAEQHRRGTGMDAAADRDGYIVAYPNGTGRMQDRLLTWNAGHCCGSAMAENVDDVAFIAAMLDDLARRAAFDPRRVYVVGHSNGGMMAYRLAEELPDRIAAIVSVAGAKLPATARGRPVPVLHIHSVDDPRALYAGGLGPPFPFTNSRVMHVGVEATMDAWMKRDGCQAAAKTVESRQSGGHSAQLLVHGGCAEGTEVALWKLTGAGHGWPGAKPALERIVGPATDVIDANAEFWRFVSRFSLHAR